MHVILRDGLHDRGFVTLDQHPAQLFQELRFERSGRRRLLVEGDGEFRLAVAVGVREVVERLAYRPVRREARLTLLITCQDRNRA